MKGRGRACKVVCLRRAPCSIPPPGTSRPMPAVSWPTSLAVLMNADLIGGRSDGRETSWPAVDSWAVAVARGRRLPNSCSHTTNKSQPRILSQICKGSTKNACKLGACTIAFAVRHITNVNTDQELPQ